MKIFILSIFAVLAVSCSDPKFIRGTKIPDNKQNRELIEVVEKYRKTLIKMDAPGLLAMAHPEYYQPAVTTEDIPYDYKGLKNHLSNRFKLIRNIRFEMQYRKVTWKDTETASVEIFIDASYLIKVANEEQWKKKSDYWKIDLKKHEGVWKIIGGM